MKVLCSVLLLTLVSWSCRSTTQPDPDSTLTQPQGAMIQYLEIVTPDVDRMC